MRRLFLGVAFAVFIGGAAFLVQNLTSSDAALSGCIALGVDPTLKRTYMGAPADLQTFISPDNRYVAVQWAGSHGHAYFHIYECASQRRRLFGSENGYEPSVIWFKSWLNATEFAYENRDQPQTADASTLFPDRTFDEIMLAPLEATRVIGISPDGAWELFYSSATLNNHQDILRRRLTDLTHIENVTRSIGIHTFIEWSPDGQSFLFWSTRDGMPELYRLDWQTLTMRRLTFSIAGEFDAHWSADGKFINFTDEFSRPLTLKLLG